MAARADWTSHLLQYSMNELRRRQDLCQQQIAVAFRAKNNRALLDLQTMDDSLTEAVMIKNGYIHGGDDDQKTKRKTC